MAANKPKTKNGSVGLIGAGRRAASNSTRAYRRFIAFHPMHGLTIATIGVLFFMSGEPIIALVACLATELIVLLALPYLTFIRRAIDRTLVRRQKRDELEKRTAMLALLSEQHRNDFAELELIARDLRARVAVPGHTGGSLPARSSADANGEWDHDHDDLLGIDELTMLYLRLALAHRDVTRVLNRPGNAAAEQQLAHVASLFKVGGDNNDHIDHSGTVAAADDARGKGAHAHGLAAAEAWRRRHNLLTQRCHSRERARSDVRAIEVDLATIGDTFRWMEEHCTNANVSALRRELDLHLASSWSNVETMRELCTLSGEYFNDDFDRAAAAAAAAVAASRASSAASPASSSPRPNKGTTGESATHTAPTALPTTASPSEENVDEHSERKRVADVESCEDEGRRLDRVAAVSNDSLAAERFLALTMGNL